MASAFVTESRTSEPPPSGAARAAVLLLAMGTPGASRLLKHLTPEEIRALRQGAVGLQPVTREELDRLVGEFQEAFKTGPGLNGPARQMKELLQSSLSEEELASILSDEEDDEEPVFDVGLGAVWSEIEKLDHDVLGAALVREHPQVVAVLLAKLDPGVAATVVLKLAAPIRNDVMRRMLSVKPLAIPVRHLFEAQLRQGLLVSPEKSSSDRHAVLADIVNRFDKRESDELLQAIAAAKPEDAIALRNLLFVFEDVVTLPQKSRLVLFDEMPADVVTIALNGAPDDIKECVLSSLAARSRRMVEAELGQAIEVPAVEIAGARRRIATAALRLAREGKIELRAPEEA